MSTFDPNSVAAKDSGIFGLPYSYSDSAIIFCPVPWEATVSYGTGTAKGPQALFEASHQVDLFDHDVLKPYESGMFWMPESKKIASINREARAAATKVLNSRGSAKTLSMAQNKVNLLSEKLNEIVFQAAEKVMNDKKMVGVVGGDHSVPFGAIQAASKKYSKFGILHFDAHSDTRKAYEGFTWSHASIMYNVLENIPQVAKLVQIGIRDYCEEEFKYTQQSRVKVFYEGDLAREAFSGKTWNEQSKEIVSHLPDLVWVSFDIDGLDPTLCPSTGTPVPGGLSFAQANAVLRAVLESKKKIIGFDLCEVSKPARGEWDANVGARMLYKIAAWTLASQGLAKRR